MNKAINLGRLTNVELRTVFASEAIDFTPWLAAEENLNLLGDVLGIPLQLEALEKQVGRYQADILCKDGVTQNWVVIENQIEETDHSHLGQVLTYAAGLQAVTIVWVAQSFTDEHRAALDWLNERTEEGVNFFGLEIELWKIGDSLAAPKFNVVCRPNGWSRRVKAAVGGTTAKSEWQRQFWVDFKKFMEANSTIKCYAPQPQNWMYHSGIGKGFDIASVASYSNSEKNDYSVPEIRVQLEISGDRSKEYFAELEAQRSQVEQLCGTGLVWLNPQDANVCRILVRKDADFRQKELWPEQQEWLKQKVELFTKVFQPIATQLLSSTKVTVASA